MSETAESTIYEFGEFRLDAARRRLFLRETGESIEIQPKAIELLIQLAENAGAVLTKTELLDTVWKDTIVEEANLSQTVFVLRKALHDDRKNPRFIVTIPNRGYRFIAKVDRSAPAADPAEVDSPANGIKPAAAQSSRPNIVPIALIAIIFLLLIAFGLFFLRPYHPPETIREVRSIAVLPFKNTGGKTDEDYLGNGLADVLASKLSRLKTFVVRPTNAVVKFTDASPDPRRIGSELNVEALVTGRVQKIGENIRVTVQLVRTADGATLWAETFDDKFTNIFAVQDSISKKVADTFALQLTNDERRLLAKRDTDSPEAYNLYLQGRFLWNKRTPETLSKAVEEFEKARALDPNFALAYVGLADCYVLLAEYHVTTPADAFPKARDAALKALELDQHLAEPIATLAYIAAFYDWNYPAAEEEFKRAIEENPNDATARQWYSEFLGDMGRFDEAQTHLDEAIRIDPTSPIMFSSASHLFYNRHQFDEAIEKARKCLELDPNFGMCYANLGFAYEKKGMMPEAADAIAKSMDLLGEPADAAEEIRKAFKTGGIKGLWEKRLQQMLTRPHLKNIPATSVAIVYAEIGNKDKALEWLNRAVENHERYLVSAKNYPWFDFLHGDPRFQDLLRRLNL